MEYNEQLRKVQLLELEIAKEIKRICEKNNIKYFMLWGSLLGAVRHGGFIPWDDDMDFGMLRNDYEKFLSVCKKELDSQFFLQTWDTDLDYPFAYAKVRLKGTHFVEKFSENSQMNNGIFVDIFPLDNVPKSNILRIVRNIRCFFCERLMWLKKGMGKNIKDISKFEKVKYIIFSFLSKFVPYRWLKKHYKRVLLNYNSNNTDIIMETSVINPFKNTALNKKIVEQIDEIRFETTQFPAFKYRKEYLAYIYGDFMSYPPEEERHGHLPVDIDFGPYK